MAVNWTPVAMDVGVGGAAGVADQMLQNWDEKRKRADPTLSMWQQGGTYLNYGVPILSVLALAMGWLKEPWASRAVLAGSQLAGRKATYTMTKAAQSAPYTPVPNYQAVREQAAAQQAAREHARRYDITDASQILT